MRETEQKKKIVEYIKKNLKKGYTLEALRWALVKQGYSRVLVETSVDLANKELANSAPIIETKPEISYEVIDEFDTPVVIEKPWWKRIFGF